MKSMQARAHAPQPTTRCAVTQGQARASAWQHEQPPSAPHNNTARTRSPPPPHDQKQAGSTGRPGAGLTTVRHAATRQPGTGAAALLQAATAARCLPCTHEQLQLRWRCAQEGAASLPPSQAATRHINVLRSLQRCNVQRQRRNSQRQHHQHASIARTPATHPASPQAPRHASAPASARKTPLPERLQQLPLHVLPRQQAVNAAVSCRC